MTVVAENAVWTWFNWPKAVYSPVYGKTFFGWASVSGFAYVGSYDCSAGEVVTHQLNASSEVDDHTDAAVIVLDAAGPNPGKILAAFAHHHGAAATYVSTAAGDVSAFAAGVQTEASGTTYASLAQMADTAKTVYLFYRKGATPPTLPHLFKTSTDGGATWGSATTLINTGAQRPYVQIRKTGASRIDVLFTNGNPNEVTCSVYHFYMTVAANGTRSYFKSDGTSIGGDAQLPITTANATKVYDGATTNSWVWDLGLVEGNLTALYTTFSADNHTYRRAVLSGGVWTSETVCDGGPTSTDYLYAAEPYYSGGICLDPNNAAVLYVSRKYGAGDFRVERWEKRGASWVNAATISGDTDSVNARPRWVENSAPATRFMYWRGTYTSYTSYDTDVHFEEQLAFAGALRLSRRTSRRPSLTGTG